MKIKTLCTLALLLLTASFASAQQVTRCGGPALGLYINWPMFQFDVCHTGNNPYETSINAGNAQDLILAWREYNIESSSVVVNGVVYSGKYINGKHGVTAVTAQDGTNLWRYDAGDTVSATPAIVKGTLYVGSADQNVYALDATTGALVWKYATGGAITDGATVDNGVVYVVSQDKKLYALNAVTGAFLWSQSYFAGYIGSPAVVNGIVYIGTKASAFFAFNAVTGNPLWQATLNQNYPYHSPTVINGVVYIAGGDTYALNALTGATLWHVFAPPDDGFNSSTVMAGGVIYVGSFRGLYALDAKSGQQLYFTPISSPVQFVSTANGVVYLTSMDFNCYALDATTGQVLWSYQIDFYYSPAIVNGTLYDGASVFRLPIQ